MVVDDDGRVKQLLDRRDKRPREVDFQFDGKTAAVFDDMVGRSVPMYDEIQRLTVELATMESVNPDAVKYLNRLSDWFFVAGRIANDDGRSDVLWVPGLTRPQIQGA